MDDIHRIDLDAVGYLAPALDLLTDVCQQAGVPFFVVGAAARDLLLEHVYGVRPFRATGDVDIAVAVQHWDEYESLIERLVDDHGFKRSRVAHRVERPGLVVDVVPFGPIAGETDEVAWPKGDRTMSVLGYSEAFGAAVQIQIGDGSPVRVASLPGLVILKLVAWSEDPHRRKQDPIDVGAVMMNYSDVADDLLFTEHADLLEDPSFDVSVAGARILGRDVAPLLRNDELKTLVLNLLRANTADDYESPFVQGMGQGPGQGDYRDFSFRLRCLRALRAGVEESLADIA